jgi:hypothetical protein
MLNESKPYFLASAAADNGNLRQKGSQFHRRKLKNGSHVPSGDDQGMTFADREGVQERPRRFRFEKNALPRQIAEWTPRRIHPPIMYEPAYWTRD